MLKKGGILLGLILCAVVSTNCLGQTPQPENSQLANLGEATEYTGSPLIYIEGMRAPEKANNAMEELQLKLFGTKNIREATKDTLKLSDDVLPPPENQVQNFVFQTPFHKTIQSAFIPHIANFMVIMQILDQEQLTVSEHITLVNTTEDNFWKQDILLAPGTTAQAVSYLQNGKSYSVDSEPQKDSFMFQSPIPLQLGPNYLVLKYNIKNPFQQNLFKFNLVAESSVWAIEQFKTLILFPNAVEVTSSKLLFGNNKLEIPDIYTQQIDKQSNINITINRVVPPRASIDLEMNLNTSALPTNRTSQTTPLILWIAAVVFCLYWFLFGWWEKHRLNGIRLPRIKYPHTITTLASQMGTSLTQQKWEQLINFGEINNWPLAKLLAEKQTLEHASRWTRLKIRLSSFLSLMLEPIIGTVVLLIGVAVALCLTKETFPIVAFCLLILFCFVGLILLYTFGLKVTRKLYWQKKLNQLSQPATLAGLTSQQVRQIYPLFILTQHHEDWRKDLIKINPKVAQETHLYKEKK